MTPAEVLAALKARITNRKGGNVTRVPDDDLRALIEIAEAAPGVIEAAVEAISYAPGWVGNKYGDDWRAALNRLRAAIARLGKGE